MKIEEEYRDPMFEKFQIPPTGILNGNKN